MSYPANAVRLDTPDVTERDTIPDPVCRVVRDEESDGDDEPDTQVDWPRPAMTAVPEAVCKSVAPSLRRWSRRGPSWWRPVRDIPRGVARCWCLTPTPGSSRATERGCLIASVADANAS